MNMDRHEATASASAPPPISEADLHAYVDRKLSPARLALVEQFLAAYPAERARTRDWEEQNELLRGLLNPVLNEPVPAAFQSKPSTLPPPWRALAAGVLIALVGAGAGWSLRGLLDADTRRALADQATAPYSTVGSGDGALTGFARRAAIAHVVYSPDVRRPVEVAADQEQALVAWLTKRMGTAVRAPSLAAMQYELMGGRLLPGEKGPVAQFMYRGPGSRRLTLYVTREVAGQDTAFKFAAVAGAPGPRVNRR